MQEIRKAFKDSLIPPYTLTKKMVCTGPGKAPVEALVATSPRSAADSLRKASPICPKGTLRMKRLSITLTFGRWGPTWLRKDACVLYS